MGFRLLLFGFFITSQVATANSNYNLKPKDYSRVQSTNDWGKRPFRTGVLKLSRDLDESKPLAPIDYAGWVYSAGFLIGSEDLTKAVAISAKNKKIQWSLPIEGGLTAPPIVQGAWVMLASRDRYLYKVDISSGDVLWKTHLDAFVTQKISKLNNKLFAVTANQSLYCIDFETGKIDWAYDSGVSYELSVRSSLAPTIQNGIIYYGLANGEIAAVKADKGKKVWQINPFFSKSQMVDLVGEIVFHKNQLIFSRYDGVVGRIDLLNPNDSPNLWLKGDNSSSISTSAFREGIFYLGFVDGKVSAYKVETDTKIWETNIGTPVSYLTPGESHLYVSSATGLISAVSNSSGEIVWSDELGSNIITAPIYMNNNVYFATGLRNLYGYKLNL